MRQKPYLLCFLELEEILLQPEPVVGLLHLDSSADSQVFVSFLDMVSALSLFSALGHSNTFSNVGPCLTRLGNRTPTVLEPVAQVF